MADSSYHNFDLFFQREGDAYRVRADSDEGQAANTFTLPFSDMELENFLLTTRPGRRGVRRVDAPDVAAAKRFGGNLFGAVFSGDVQGIWRSSLSSASQQNLRLRVRLRFTDTPELADLPWEYLFSTSLNRFLVLDDELAIVRYLDMPERTRPVAVTLPLRVLTAISNPADFPKLDVEQEWANMREALGPLEERGLVQIDLLEEATFPALRRQLQKKEYHIFHFIGHGAFDRQSEEGVLVFKDENGRGRLVSGQQLGWLLHNYRSLALAIINACEGGRADRTDAFAGTAQSLVQQGIPAVVAMQFEITDDAAKTLSYAFYTALAGGVSVENALFEARMAIFAEDPGLEWATPVLYTRAPDGHLFDITGSPQPQAQPQPEQPKKAALLETQAQPVIVPEPAVRVEERREVPQPDFEANSVTRNEQIGSRQEHTAPQPDPEAIKAAQVEALYGEAHKAMERSDFATAIQKARGALALDPQNENTASLLRYVLHLQEMSKLYKEGQAHFKARLWPDAISVLSQVRDRQPGYMDVDKLIATAQAKIAEAQSQPVKKTEEKSRQTTLPPWVKYAAGLGALGVILLVIVVALLSGSLFAGSGPLASPISESFSDVPAQPFPTDTVVASDFVPPTDTAEAGNVAESTPEPTLDLAGGGEGKLAFDGSITIGLDAPLSGAQEPFGTAIRNGMQLALNDAVDRGGIRIGDKNYTLEMAALDDALSGVSDPAQAVKNAQSFIDEQGVVAIVGPFNGSLAAAQMPVLNEAGMAQIGVGTTREELTKPEYGQTETLRPTGKITYFRVSETNDIQGPAVAEYLSNVSKNAYIQKLYILDDGDTYGKDLADSVEKEFQARGGQVLGHESISVPADSQSLSTELVDKLATLGPWGIYFGGISGNNIGIARKLLKEDGQDIPFIGGDGILDDEFISQAGDAANGSYATFPGPDVNQLPSAKNFLDEYKSSYGDTNDGYILYSAQAYEATNIIIDAIERAQSTDREAVRSAIAATKDYAGILGTTSFDENGDTTNRWVAVYEVIDGKWQFVDQFQYTGK